jgi:tetratricopeptide (TPR) repeat protein
MQAWLSGPVAAMTLLLAAAFAPAFAEDDSKPRPAATTEVRIIGLRGGPADSLERVGLSAYAEAVYGDAEEAFLAGIRAGGRGDDDDKRSANLAQLHSNLAWLYIETGRFAAADSSLRRALAIDRRLEGDDSPEVARRTAELALLHQAGARYESAAPLLDQAIALYARNPKSEPREVAFTLHLVARNYHATGDTKQSETFYRKVLDELDENETLDASLWATTMLNLAELYHATHRNEDARLAFERALKRANQVYADGGLPNALVLNPYAVLQRRAEAVRAMGDTAARN